MHVKRYSVIITKTVLLCQCEVIHTGRYARQLVTLPVNEARAYQFDNSPGRTLFVGSNYFECFRLLEDFIERAKDTCGCLWGDSGLVFATMR